MLAIIYAVYIVYGVDTVCGVFTIYGVSRDRQKSLEVVGCRKTSYAELSENNVMFKCGYKRDAIAKSFDWRYILVGGRNRNIGDIDRRNHIVIITYTPHLGLAI